MTTIRLVSMAFGAALAAAACLLEPGTGVTITNDLTQSVVISYESGGKMFTESLEPRDATIMRFDLADTPEGKDCITSDIVVRDSDGVEVARIAPPRCIGDGIWLSFWTPSSSP